MNNLYVCKVSANQASGNQIDIQRKIGISFFGFPESYFDEKKNYSITICHINDVQSFETIELQPATNLRFSTRLNSFLADNGDIIANGDLLVFERIGRAFCVRCIKSDDSKYDALYDLFDEDEKHMLISADLKAIDNMEDYEDSFRLFLAAIRTKPFILLAGISGTGKSRIVRRLAQASVTEDLQHLYDPTSVINGLDRWKLHKPANFELIQVKPNWHNSMEVVGYKSNIGGIHYEFTPFIEFVARAWQHQDVPFFLCLDEMNLAPVEQYFAEFLSAIESRTKENGAYMTDPIIKPFESFDTKDSQGHITDCLSDRMIAKLIGALDTQEKSDLAEQFRTKGLTLPKNLIVMGTVNMDETTFSFSRKVLDRAMSIVMNEVDLEAYFNHKSDIINTELKDEVKNALIDRPISGLEVKDALGDDANKVRSFFEAVNTKLDGTPFKLGYRAISEALLYASAAKVFDGKSIKEALDQFTLMKILSRIEGDKRSIGSLLTDLQEVITEEYSKSHKKLEQMSSTLEHSQFVSYWT